MRTFRSLLPLALTIASTLLLSSPAAAQRHGPRSDFRSHPRPHTVSTPVADTAASCDTQDCAEDQSEDYSVNVVNALFPYNDGVTVGPPLVTLVVQNSGSARSPGSIIAVAPRNHLSMVSRLTIPSLAPGEKAVVQVPVEMGSDGAPCIAITISPDIVSPFGESLRYASAATIGAPRPAGK